jgi:hypothetical protein
MAKTNSDTYYETKNENGAVVLCPMAVSNRPNFEDCVEEDVVRRYSGNIDADTAFLKGN